MPSRAGRARQAPTATIRAYLRTAHDALIDITVRAFRGVSIDENIEERYGLINAVAWQDRKEAGFTEEELTELAQLSGEGPSKDTLLAAAKILQERHREVRSQGDA